MSGVNHELDDGGCCVPVLTCGSFIDRIVVVSSRQGLLPEDSLDVARTPGHAMWRKQKSYRMFVSLCRRRQACVCSVQSVVVVAGKGVVVEG